MTAEHKPEEHKTEVPMEGLKDARTFLRNVLPGLAVVIEFAFFAWLFRLFETQEWLKTKEEWHLLAGDSPGGMIAGAVTLFIASGAAGYIVANVYHAIVNWLPFFRFFDYRLLLRSLTRTGKLEVLVPVKDGNAIKDVKIDFNSIKWFNGWQRRYLLVVPAIWDIATAMWIEWGESRRSWALLTAIWAERRDKIQAATERSESLLNVAHGAGTLFVGSFLAWLFAFTWWALTDKGQMKVDWNYLLCNLIGPMVVLVHYFSLRWTALGARDFNAIIVGDLILRETGPVKVYYYALGEAEPPHL